MSEVVLEKPKTFTQKVIVPIGSTPVKSLKVKSVGTKESEGDLKKYLPLELILQVDSVKK
jgi:hypothetical protein